MRALLEQSIRFAAVGIVNTSIGLTAIYAFLYFGRFNPAIANLSGYAIGLIASFLLNRLWTFKDPRPIRSSFLKYTIAVGLAYALNLTIVLMAIYGLGIDKYLAQLLGISIYTIAMFFGCRNYVFRMATTTPTHKSPQIETTRP